MAHSVIRDQLPRTQSKIGLDFVKQAFFALGLISSLLSMAFGAPMAALFLLCTIGLIVSSYRELPTVLTKLNLVYVLPILFLISTLWSVYPSLTLRSAIQFIFTMSFSTVAVAAIRPQRLIEIVTVVFLLVVAISFLYIGQVFQGRPLRGPFGSKNIMAHIGAISTILSATGLLLRTSNSMWKVVCAAGSILSFTVILFAASAGALVSSILGIAVAICALIIGAVKSFTRAILVIFMLLASALLAIMWKPIQVFLENFIVVGLGKDLTFTGRTDIWMIGSEVAQQRPIYGFGYYSFWTPDNPIAVRIWKMFDIESQTGFNFHNEFMEIAVGNGLVGVVLLTLTVLATWALLFVKVVRKEPHAYILVGLYAYLFSKLFVETAVNYPFSSNTVVFWLVVASALLPRQLESARSGRRSAASIRSDNQFHALY
jgi:exopolysaccharide production protein ExoQ